MWVCAADEPFRAAAVGQGVGKYSVSASRYPFTPRRVSSPSSRARSPTRVVVVPLRRVLRIRVQSAMTDASTPVRLGAWVPVRVESRRRGSPGHAPRESRSTPLGSRTPGLTDTDTDSGCARRRRRPLQIGASASAVRAGNLDFGLFSP